MKKDKNTGSISRANAKSIANQLSKVVNGLGTSKVKAKLESNLTGQNGHKKSDKVHSAKALDNFRSVAKNYFEHIKDNEGGKIEKSINIDTVKNFIQSKLSSGAKGSTVNTYISVLEKVSEALTELTGKEYMSKSDFKVMKDEIKETHDLKKEHLDRSYTNPKEIVKEMDRFSEFSLSAKLQFEVGLRADDAINSQKWNLNKDGSLTIKGSKGGIAYKTTPLSKTLQAEVLEAKKDGYKTSYKSYRDDLKEAVENSGQKWDKKSTHGLRYNFAQNRIEELKNQGKGEDEAKGK